MTFYPRYRLANPATFSRDASHKDFLPSRRRPVRSTDMTLFSYRALGMVVVLLVILVNLFTDIVYALIDPRIKRELIR